MLPIASAALDFTQCRANFYLAARDGLRAEVVWFNGRRWPLQQLLLDDLLPLARRALLALDLDAADVADYLDIIAARVATGRTGANWQRRFLDQHGADLTTLMLTYLERQRGGTPVHEWAV
jgi:hypothetical protein